MWKNRQFGKYQNLPKRKCIPLWQVLPTVHSNNMQNAPSNYEAAHSRLVELTLLDLWPIMNTSTIHRRFKYEHSEKRCRTQ